MGLECKKILEWHFAIKCTLTPSLLPGVKRSALFKLGVSVQDLAVCAGGVGCGELSDGCLREFGVGTWLGLLCESNRFSLGFWRQARPMGLECEKILQ